MSKFDRFPNSFHFKYQTIDIEFKNSSRSLSFWINPQKRLIDLIDIVYVPLEFEGTNEHDLIWSNKEIKNIAIRFIERTYISKLNNQVFFSY